MPQKTKQTKKQFAKSFIFVGQTNGNKGHVKAMSIDNRGTKHFANVFCSMDHAVPLAHALARHAQYSVVFPVSYFFSKAHLN